MIQVLGGSAICKVASQLVSLVYKHMGRHTVLQALSAREDNMYGRSDAIRLKAAAKCQSNFV